MGVGKQLCVAIKDSDVKKVGTLLQNKNLDINRLVQVASTASGGNEAMTTPLHVAGN